MKHTELGHKMWKNFSYPELQKRILIIGGFVLIDVRTLSVYFITTVGLWAVHQTAVQ
jgi:hypothetical protein